MGLGKFGGSTCVWAIALVAGLMLARTWLRERMTAMLEDTDKYAVWPESPNFAESSEFTITEPIIPENYYLQPGDD